MLRAGARGVMFTCRLKRMKGGGTNLPCPFDSQSATTSIALQLSKSFCPVPHFSQDKVEVERVNSSW